MPRIETEPRTIATIARDIEAAWPKPYFGAVPYIRAMKSLRTIDDKYGLDDAKEIITYFLVNAGTFRGPRARELKAELKKIGGIK